MPFKSEQQRKFLWKNHPEIARRWANEEKMPKNDKLPPMKGRGKSKNDSEARANAISRRFEKNLKGGKKNGGGY